MKLRSLFRRIWHWLRPPAIWTKVVQLPCPSVIGSQDITVEGAREPRAATLTVTTHEEGVRLIRSRGITDGRRECVTSVVLQECQGVYVTHVHEDEIIHIEDGDGTIIGSARFGGWLSNGLRLVWKVPPPNDHELFVQLIGGRNCEAHVGVCAPAPPADDAS